MKCYALYDCDTEKWVTTTIYTNHEAAVDRLDNVVIIVLEF